MYKTYFTVLILLVSACSPAETTAVPIAADVIVETPQAEIVGGARLEPPEPRWDGYGEAVDVYGDVLVVGASEWNTCGHGSAYVYRASGEAWQMEAHLAASDQDEFSQQARQFEGQRFGTAVALGEGIMAVGAPGNVPPTAGGHPGAVYVYGYDGHAWMETTKLMPELAVANTVQSTLTPGICGRMRPGAFGALLALDDHTLAVGGDADGLVYLYQQDEQGWQEQARVTIPTLPERTLYMSSLALFGDALALSAFYLLPQPEESLVLTGNVVVYIFERTGDAWQETFRFAPEGEADILFFSEVNVGASVALSGQSGQANLLAVGLPGFPDWSGIQEHNLMFGAGPGPDQIPEFPTSNRQSGAVYLLERVGEGWNQAVTLKPAGSENPPGPSDPFFRFPSYLFEEQNEAAQADFYAAFVFPGHIFSEAPEVTFFGATVDLDGNQLAVTAGFANATYLFARRGEEWVYQFRVKPVQEKIELWEDWAQVVRINGRTLLLGTPSEFGNSAYVFSLDTGN
jgi:hypothetical protein